MKLLIATYLTWVSLSLQAQNFSYKAQVDAVKATGFYQIQLTPSLASRANATYSDLRLFDNKGKEIPYLLKKEEQHKQEDSFKEYEIISSESNDEWQSIVVHNPYKTAIDQLLFEMKHADADRTIRISGSNDNVSYYVVRDHFNFSAYDAESTTTLQKIIRFPSVDYSYYKIEIKNKNKSPLNILKIGYTSSTLQQPSYLEVSGLSYTRKDSNKKTYLFFTCTPGNRIDQLEVKVSSPQLYHRHAILNIEETIEPETELLSASTRKFKSRYNVNNVQQVELTSDEINKIETNQFLSDEKQHTFELVIDNLDDEALQFESIKAYQLRSSLVAELKQEHTYFIYVGDSLLEAPLYDLVYFSSKLKEHLPLVNIQNVLPKSENVAQEYSNKNDRYFLWIGLAIVGIILFFLSSSMLKNMKKQDA